MAVTHDLHIKNKIGAPDKIQDGLPYIPLNMDKTNYNLKLQTCH